jgi:CheY-like chemotaxis protein
MPKLLVVDDDESLRRLMGIVLGDSYEVIESGEPEQGLALALDHKPDAILLDLRMPKYSGYELLQTYTSFCQTQNVPVVIVSGEAGGQTKEHCQKLGAVGYFEKPIDFDALRTCLSRVIKTRRYIPRSEVRIRLQLSLRLCGKDTQGESVEEVVITEHVSLNGFVCGYLGKLPESSTVDVYLTSPKDVYVGKAQVLPPEIKAGVRQHGCRFLQKSNDWVLK